jgi:hypothetical protein
MKLRENDIVYNNLIKQYEFLNTDMIWNMKDYTKISISDMQNSHIQNCINMLKKKYPNSTREAWIDIFDDVLFKRRNLKLNKIYQIIKKNKL